MLVQSRSRATSRLSHKAMRTGLGAIIACAGCLVGSTALAQQPPPPPPPQVQPEAPPPQEPYALPPDGGRPIYVRSPPRYITDWNEGDPVPQGYHPVERKRPGLIAAGVSLFASFYFISVLSAAVEQDIAGVNQSNPAAALYIPALGPFIQMAHSNNLATDNFLLAVDGIAQAGGIAMFCVGMTSRTVLMRNELGKPTIIPTPIVGRGTGGFGLLGTF